MRPTPPTHRARRTPCGPLHAVHENPLGETRALGVAYGPVDPAPEDFPPSAVTREPRTPLSIPVDRGAAEVLADLTQRAVDGAGHEATGRTAARAIALVLAALLGLRVVFDAVLPTLLVGALGGAVLVALTATIVHAINESRRQRALLVALAQLSRMSRLDPEARERVAPHVAAVIDALRTPVAPPWKRS